MINYFNWQPENLWGFSKSNKMISYYCNTLLQGFGKWPQCDHLISDPGSINLEALKFFRVKSSAGSLHLASRRGRKNRIAHRRSWWARPECGTHYLSLPELSQMVTSDLRGGWENIINVYALKKKRTWIPVKLVVWHNVCFKNTEIIFLNLKIFIYSVYLGSVF